MLCKLLYGLREGKRCRKGSKRGEKGELTAHYQSERAIDAVLNKFIRYN